MCIVMYVCMSFRRFYSQPVLNDLPGLNEIVLYRLSYCGVTDEGCAALASALRSNPSHLRELDLSLNKLRHTDVKLLSDLKDNPHYKLETLK